MKCTDFSMESRVMGNYHARFGPGEKGEITPNPYLSAFVNAFTTWNEKVAEIWQLVMAAPETFKGGGIWIAMEGINNSLKAIGYALLVLFAAISIFGGTMNMRELRRPETALRYFIRFIAAKTAVGYCMDIMLVLFDICGGVASQVAMQMSQSTAATVSLPQDIIADIESVGFFASIPLWIVSLLGSLLITVLSFVLIMTVYGRFFRLYLYTAIAPIPMACFAGETTAQHGKQFIRNYMAVCLEGAVVMLALIIFSAFASGNPTTTADTAVMKVWAYLAETVFNMLICVGLVKASDRMAKELFGL